MIWLCRRWPRYPAMTGRLRHYCHEICHGDPGSSVAACRRRRHPSAAIRPAPRSQVPTTSHLMFVLMRFSGENEFWRLVAARRDHILAKVFPRRGPGNERCAYKPLLQRPPGSVVPSYSPELPGNATNTGGYNYFVGQLRASRARVSELPAKFPLGPESERRSAPSATSAFRP